MEIFSFPRLSSLHNSYSFIHNTYMRFRPWIIPVLIILSSVLFSLILSLIYNHIFIVAWDETAYAEWASWTADAIRAGDIQKIISVNLIHFDRPPLPTLIHAIGIVLLNRDTITVGRIINTFWYIISACIFFLLSRNFAPKHQKKQHAIISAILFLSSPMMIIFSHIGLREMIGVTLTLLTVLLYIRAYHSRKTIDWILLSLSYCILMFTRYNYSIIVLVPLGIEQCIRAITTKTYTRVFAEIIIAIIPAWLMLAIYIYSSGNTFASFFAIFTSGVWNITGNIGTVLDHVLFYPNSILYIYSISPLVGAILLLGFISGLRHLKIVEFRIGITLVILNILLGIQLSANLQERYIITIVPFIFIIAAYELISFLSVIRINQKGINAILVLCSVIMMTIPIIHPSTICAIGAYTLRYPLCNQPDYSDLIFSYDKKQWAKQLPPPGYQTPQDVYRWIAQTIDLSKTLIFIGESNEFSQPYRNIMFEQYKKEGISPVDPTHSAFVVVLIIEPSSRFYTRDYRMINEWKLGQFAPFAADPAFSEIAEKKFGDLGVTIRILAQ